MKVNKIGKYNLASILFLPLKNQNNINITPKSIISKIITQNLRTDKRRIPVNVLMVKKIERIKSISIMVELGKKSKIIYVHISLEQRPDCRHSQIVNRLMYVNTCKARYYDLNDFVKKKIKYKQKGILYRIRNTIYPHKSNGDYCDEFVHG